MRGVSAIFRRELAGLFFSPLAWLLFALALAPSGWVFSTALKEFSGDVTASLAFASGGSMFYWAVMLFLPPLVTMRMISEESRNGLLEFLMTSPVSDAAVVLGKFLAAWTFLALLWASTLVYALTLEGLGVAPDWPPVVGGYVGALLVSALFLSIGLLSSSLFSTPALSAFMSLCGSLVVLFLPPLVGLFDFPWLHATVAEVDVLAHFQRSFQIGVLDTQVLLFFSAWAGFFLFLTVRSVEARRWS